jgi:hypothetical protein
MLDFFQHKSLFSDLIFLTNNDLKSLPFVWIWFMSLLVVFLLELAVFASYYFNTKHFYINNISHKSIFFLSFLKLIKNKNSKLLNISAKWLL